MNRKMTLLALAAKCGGFGASGSSGEQRGAVAASRRGRAGAPAPDRRTRRRRRRKSRRERTGRMCGSRFIAYPLSPVLRGEGRGEGPLRGRSQAGRLTLTARPRVQARGDRVNSDTRTRSRSAACGRGPPGPRRPPGRPTPAGSRQRELLARPSRAASSDRCCSQNAATVSLSASSGLRPYASRKAWVDATRRGRPSARTRGARGRRSLRQSSDELVVQQRQRLRAAWSCMFRRAQLSQRVGHVERLEQRVAVVAPDEDVDAAAVALGSASRWPSTAAAVGRSPGQLGEDAGAVHLRVQQAGDGQQPSRG